MDPQPPGCASCPGNQDARGSEPERSQHQYPCSFVLTSLDLCSLGGQDIFARSSCQKQGRWAILTQLILGCS